MMPLWRNRSYLRFSTSLSRKFSDGIIKSKVPNVEIPQVSLVDYVWKNLDRWHNKTALVCAETGRSYLYSDVYAKSKKLSDFLSNFPGLRKGDVVATIFPNIPEYLIVILGVLQAGFKLTSVNPAYTKDEIKRHLEDASAKFIFTLTELAPAVYSATETLPTKNIPIVLINHSQEQMSVPSNAIKFKEIFERDYQASFNTTNAKEVIYIPYSSGTSGLPKGVEITNANIVYTLHIQNIPEFVVRPYINVGSQHVLPGVLPIFHIYGFEISLFNLSIGSKIVTLPKFTVDRFVKLLRTYKPTYSYLVPPIINLLTHNPSIKTEDIIHMRSIVTGAAPFGVNDMQMFEEKTLGKVTLIQAYGQTETTAMGHCESSVITNGRKRGSVGLTYPNLECKVVSSTGENQMGLGPNQQGELLIRGPSIFKGYLNHSKATQSAIDSDGWYRTGDIFYYDEDERFFITDRLKELIKVKGFQVAPAELEDVLRSHPDVDDAAVIGVPHSVCGEVPKAFVVPRDKTSVNCTNIQEYMSSKVAKYKQLLGGIVVVDSIPKTASGKILRRILREY